MTRFEASPALPDVPRIDGARIAVVLENKFIAEEIAAYLMGFPLLGAKVELVARIWWGDSKPASETFFADVDPSDDEAWQTPDRVDIARDVSQVAPSNYDAIIMAANYTSVRLRYPGDMWEDPAKFNARAHVQSAPLVRFFADAMAAKAVTKGFLCHGLWILTPNPDLLRGRKVICHSVVMADILNAGADIKLTQDRTVTDEDVVTGFSKHEVLPFIAAIARRISDVRSRGAKP